MKKYAILYYDYTGNIEVLTVDSDSAEGAKNYALSHYSHLIKEHWFIKAVKV